MKELHAWSLTPAEAKSVQDRLRKRLVSICSDRIVTSIGGVDVGFNGDRSRAVIVVLRFPGLEPLEVAKSLEKRLFQFPVRIDMAEVRSSILRSPTTEKTEVRFRFLG